ncbi:MAG: hypothetical protein US49_C0004G0008 [candidate division TM6 bacterium GW2011_GWF2_37_49]|nr:MAG: hypothetical protein US49_C0004G0008 [candidate division TM6 bacterium GW2011_GWF2_37_49]HBG23480.1 hypothetical protein [Rikenellaceae bacterium]
MKKTTIILCFTLLFISGLKAQNLEFGGDLFNRYIWRGLDLGGKSPSIQPWMKLTLGNEDHAFSIGAWGAFSLAGTANEETDLYLSYTYKGSFSITLTDYFFPGLNTGSKDKYFEWSKDKTGHILEGTLAYNGSEKIPFTLLFAMNLFGNDARKSNGDLFLSKYIEVGYKTRLKQTDLNVFVGGTPDNPNIAAGESSFYLNEKPGIINVGLKLSRTLQITENFSIPVQCSVISNPALNKIYLALGLSF